MLYLCYPQTKINEHGTGLFKNSDIYNHEHNPRNREKRIYNQFVNNQRIYGRFQQTEIDTGDKSELYNEK